MIRLPYSWRRVEGVNNGIPKLRVLHYKLDCVFENLYIRLARLPKCGVNTAPRKEKVIVSLTTFPARVDRAYYAIKSLMLQSVLADKIFLWVAESQFPGRILPKKLQELERLGLTVRWCEDLRSHKKYFYALQEQKEDELVLTYDDDIIYEKDSVEKLIRFHELYPNCVICNRAHDIRVDEKGDFLPFSKWSIHSSEGVGKPSLYLMPSTGNGCLYPYGCMPPITFDWEIAKANALTADDIWMRFCSLSNGIGVVKTRETIATLCNVWGSQGERLTLLNDHGGENQRVVDRLQKIFPNVLKESIE